MNQHVVWTQESRELNLPLKEGLTLDMWEENTLTFPPKPTGKYTWLVLSDDVVDTLPGHYSNGTLDEALVELEVWLLERMPLFNEAEILNLVGRVRRYYLPAVNDADDYQARAMLTAIYPKENAIQYTALGLASEAGEVAGQVKKALRDDEGELTPERRDALLHELGDVAWYLTMMAHEIGYSLGDVLAANLDKLAGRKVRGVIGGEGDKR